MDGELIAIGGVVVLLCVFGWRGLRVVSAVAGALYGFMLVEVRAR